MVKHLLKRKIIFLSLISMMSGSMNWLHAQTNPAAVNLPFSMNSQSGTTLPAGIAVHNFGSTPTTQTTAPGSGDLINASTNTSGGWFAEGNSGISLLASSSQAAGAIVLDINTMCKSDLAVFWTVKTILQQASRDNSMALQYRIGTSGNFTDLGTAAQVYSSAGKTAGSSTSYNINLPPALENKPLVQLRWVYWESSASTATGSRDRLSLDDIFIDGSSTNATAPIVSGNGTVCPGATTTLTASSCSGTLTWSNGATGSTINAPAGTYTATCNVPGCSSSTSAPFVVQQTNIATPTIQGPSSVCPGATAQLTAGNCTGTLTWSNGATGASITAPAGTYTATCTTADGCSSPASSPFTVTETFVPTPIIEGPVSVCPGATAQLLANNFNGSLLWSDGSTESTTNVPAGTYTFTNTVDGCSMTSAPFTVTETFVPTPIIEGPVSVCPGATVQLLANNFNGSLLWSDGSTESTTNVPAGTYTFTNTVSGDDGTQCPSGLATLNAGRCRFGGTAVWSNGATGSSIQVPAGTYTVSCVSGAGCVSSPSAPFTVTETAVTPPTITGPSQLCQDATGTITAGGCSGTVTWSTGETGESITVPPGASYTATCTVNGCTSPASDALFIQELSLPAAPTVFNDGTLCPSGIATLTASRCRFGATPVWSNGATSSSIEVPAGTYTVSCMSGGCLSAPSAPATVTPCEAPACPGYPSLVKNGSFEKPVVTNAQKWAQQGVPDWKNFSNPGNLIELQRSLFTTASAGKQYAELNGIGYGDIYQDIPVVPGQSLNWSLDHRARENNSTEIITVIISAPDGSNPQTVTHTGNISNWAEVAGTYQITPNQTEVRMRIVSSTGSTLGRANFIDNIKANYVGCGTASRAVAQEDNTIVEKMPASLTVQPNPVAAKASLALVGFEDGMISVQVVSANGTASKNIMMQYTNGATLDLDMGTYRSGMYFVKVQQGDKVAAAKVVKE